MQPFVVVDCGASGFIEGLQDERLITICSRLPNAVMGDDWYQAINLTTISPSEIFNIAEDPSNPRVVFIDLPPTSFNETTLGIILLKAQDPENMTQPYQTCLVAAGWDRSQNNATDPRGILGIDALGKSVTSTGFRLLILKTLIRIISLQNSSFSKSLCQRRGRT